MPRINSEGWNNSFKLILNVVHPSVWKLINALKKEEELSRVKIHQFIADYEQKATKKKYRNSALRIKNICEQFQYQSIYEDLYHIFFMSRMIKNMYTRSMHRYNL